MSLDEMTQDEVSNNIFWDSSMRGAYFLVKDSRVVCISSILWIPFEFGVNEKQEFLSLQQQQFNVQ